MDRRRFLALGGLAACSGTARGEGLFAGLSDGLAAIEKRSGGRLGVYVLDTGSGARGGYKANELFAMCSTFKMMLVAAVLDRVDQGKDSLEREIAVPKQPLLGNSPLTAEHAGRTMALGAVCRATISVSDNTGANLLLDLIGGPPAYTLFARFIGDRVTRLDRTETSLNESKPGDPRDTTSPAAMAESLRSLVLGDILKPESRERLKGWMMETKTGVDCLHKGMPAQWGFGDKTGSDGVTTRNDIAVVWPVGRAPVIVTAYLTECPGTDAKRNAVLAEVGRLIAGVIVRG